MTKETSRQKRDTNSYRLGGQNAQNQAMRLDFPKLADAMASRDAGKTGGAGRLRVFYATHS
jgi:hypothetical protein